MPSKYIFVNGQLLEQGEEIVNLIEKVLFFTPDVANRSSKLCVLSRIDVCLFCLKIYCDVSQQALSHDLSSYTMC